METYGIYDSLSYTTTVHTFHPQVYRLARLGVFGAMYWCFDQSHPTLRVHQNASELLPSMRSPISHPKNDIEGVHSRNPITISISRP